MTGLAVDSRQVGDDSLFLALPGEHVDGHAYVATAFARGAAAALTSRPVPGAGGPCLVVEDPLLAAGRLARDQVDRAVAGGLQVVAITGSAGKTSTKDLLAQVLEAAGPTVAPVGNLNNELGVPLTVCRIEPRTRFLVAEMGARGVGHVAYLCTIAPPQVATVLNVGTAHVGEFGSKELIAVAKGEIVEALPADGTAVLTTDDPLVWAMRDRTRARVIATSVLAEPDGPDAIWADAVEADALGRCAFTLHEKSGGVSTSSGPGPARSVGPAPGGQRGGGGGAGPGPRGGHGDDRRRPGHRPAAFALADGADRAVRRRAGRQRRLQRQPGVDARRPGHRRRRAGGPAGGQGLGGAGRHARAGSRSRRGAPGAGGATPPIGGSPGSWRWGSSPARWRPGR